MSYLVTLVVSFLATLSVASPVNVTRQSGCSSLTATNFTMNAISKANSSNLQKLALGASSPAKSAAVAPLLTETSALCLFGDVFNMADGKMTAFASDGSVAGTSNSVPSLNGVLQFNRPVHGSTNVPVDVYCKVVASENTTLLAMNGDPNNFSLCDESSSDAVLLVYKAGQAGSMETGFNWETCVAVNVTIISHRVGGG
ncbi:hypothetical protein EI94DRAFT_1801380 [Lactarius quietus]|nr:hypothetical protein EI94DRAFT_1801380 [Lactarius quietus]